jgi:hypothetical protein
MSRPQPRDGSAFPVRWAWNLYRFCASLGLAVILIFAWAFVLGGATFVESAYGTPAVQFGMYGAWWFGVLGALLALNIFCAAAIRYPWSRRQTGFVITHIGLLTLLFGCWLSRRGGIDAQMPIFEGKRNHRAYEDAHHLELAFSGSGKSETVFPIPLRTGPFNWQDYGTKLGWFPWQLASRNRAGDVLFDQDGVKLELVDYLADSVQVDAPRVKLEVSAPRMPRMGSEGREELGPEVWVPVELSVRSVTGPGMGERPAGLGARQPTGGGNIGFWLAASDAETKAFLDAGPQGALGTKGQVVLHAGGKAERFNVDEKLGKGRFPLADGTEAEVVGWFATAGLGRGAGEFAVEENGDPARPQMPAVEVKVYRPGKPDSRLVLFSDYPELSLQDHTGQVFADYWFDYGDPSSLTTEAPRGSSRLDILQSPDGKLHYRYWRRKEQQVAWARPLPADGSAVEAFTMPLGTTRLRVIEHTASPKPEKRTLPVAFSKDKTFDQKRAAVLLRLTSDGQSEEFWLASKPPEPFAELINDPGSEVKLERGDKRITLTMPPNYVELGFQVQLEDFERKLDPGTSMASHYSSRVRIVDRNDDRKVLVGASEPVLITMNAPIDFKDPQTGRSYRLFQESFNGPYEPGDPVYRKFAPGSSKPQLYSSTLTVNLDPGRGIKYVGCLLIVAGIATMFYMRAYFFTPKKPPLAAEAKPKARPVAAAAKA